MTEVKYLLVFCIFLNFIVNALIVGMPILIIQKLSLMSKHLGMAESMLGIALILSGLVFSIVPIRKNLKLSFLLAFIMQALVFILLIITQIVSISILVIYSFVLIGQFILGFSVTLGNIPYQIMLQHLVDEAYKSRVFSVNQSVVSSLVPLSYTLFGFLLPAFFTETLIVCSIVMLLMIIVFYMKMKPIQTEFEM
ncbi:hypothetical protein [Staphylococcus ratti]|uniref:MFS transporter n=1 Tax=Staphylococcus ratti TaxID=2892440 RepID=A0ABY3PDG7_9STAP|nr:hypothetical protein [Staphylococcus ratti]UEX90340.1 hypothetical protein LN051_01330 [Staphylococcus ratti]